MNPGRAAARFLAIASATLLLSGCYAAELDAEVSEDGTMSGVLFAGVALNSPEGDGEIDGEAIFNQAVAERTFPGAVVEGAIREDGYEGQQVTFTDVPLDYFASDAIESSLGTRLMITRDGTEFVVDGTQNLSFLDPSTGGDIPDPRVELTLTFPGKVTESNGDIDGRAVTWVNPSEMTARAGAAAVFSYQLIGVGVGAVVVLAGAAWFLIRRRKTADPVPAVEDEKPRRKAKKLPKRRAPKSAPKTPAVAERPVTLPPTDWWLDATAPGSSAPIELTAATSTISSSARAVAVEDLEQISTEVEDAVIGLYGPPEKKRRGR